MHFSSTFFKSKVARGIALLLLIAAIVPASLITGLSQLETNNLVSNYEHKSLVDTSQAYAMATFSNLSLARSQLLQISQQAATNSYHATNTPLLKSPMFLSVALLKQNGKISIQYGNQDRISALSSRITQKATRHKHPSRPNLIVLPTGDHGRYALFLVISHSQNWQLPSFWVAELNPEFVWGTKEIYPDDINLCVYRLDGKSTSTLFCSHEAVAVPKSTSATDINVGSWDLFLRGDFGETIWQYETQRRNPITADVPSNSNFSWIAILSLLLVALLSLMQIRKILVPLEHLIEATKRISKGNFSKVKIVGSSELSELGHAFNTMSTHIKQQLDTLQSLSTLDREIVTELNVERTIDNVLTRMQSLLPDATYYIYRLDEKGSAEVQCMINIGDGSGTTTARISIPQPEINAIKSYGLGQVSECGMQSTLIHLDLAAEDGNEFVWTLPILWQNEMYAFLSVGGRTRFYANDPNWAEFRELASRIGIVLSAHAREQQLLTQAQYDTLTGLPNRILLQDRINQAIEHSDRNGNPFWVIFLDLDHFKYVNDSMGHDAGDKLLVEISKRLHANIRETDTVARFGGDEFIIILQGDIDENQKLGIVNRILESIALPIQIDSQEFLVTSSLGISVYPSDGLTPEVLIKHADIAMYRAKEAGRNNFQFFTQSMNEKAASRMHMETLLRHALERHEFSLLYQPKVDIASSHVVGVEALIRWDNPELGRVPPNQFIRLAEEIGLIIPIGEWVMRTACQQAVLWQKAGFDTLRMSINLSIRQFENKNLVDSIKNTLTETGMNAENLELELTESLFMHDKVNVLEILNKIKALGIKLAIDDFGTGYSSLAYLNSLPIDTLKIDKTFIDDIIQGKDKSPIVDTIIALAKNLGLEVVAEGVESAEQIAYLAARNCDQIQGYYYSKPEAANTIEHLLTIGKKLTLPNSKMTAPAESLIH